MRRMIVSDFVTLDGFIAGPDDESDWARWNDEVAEYAMDLMRSVDAIVLGRVTYEVLAAYWPTEASEAEDAAMRGFMNDTEKVVFSKTLEQADWNNTTLIREVTPETVGDLKSRAGKDIVIYGSGNLVGELTELGLIDEYRLGVNPVILGLGKRIFGDNSKRHDFDLVDAKTFSNGVVLLRYVPAAASEPGEASRLS